MEERKRQGEEAGEGEGPGEPRGELGEDGAIEGEQEGVGGAEGETVADGALADEDALGEEEVSLLERDLPCVRCGYNLRGLKDGGKCPECGGAGAAVIAVCDGPDFVHGVHDAQPYQRGAMCALRRAVECGGGDVDVFQTAPMGVRRKRAEGELADVKEEEEEKERMSWPGVAVIWGVCGLVGIFLLSGLMGAWEDEEIGWAGAYGVMMIAIMAVPVVLTAAWVKEGKSGGGKEKEG